MIETPPEIAAFLSRQRTPRARATKKLIDVSERLAEGREPLDRALGAWVMGSYVRGAPDVGDVDLFLAVDEPRSRQQQGLDAFYRRAHPYSEIVSALGCGGASFVNVEVQPVFASETFNAEKPPKIVHVVTQQPFDPQPQLLWRRAEGIREVQRRLEAMPEDPSARRFERTTSVPLIDDITDLIGVETAFLLAVQLRQGTLALVPHLLEPAPPPEPSQEILRYRYKEGSARAAAAAAALSLLAERGIDPTSVELVDRRAAGPAYSEEDAQTRVDFNVFRLYKLGAGDYPTGWHHLHVWPKSRTGPWLALEVDVIDSDRAGELYHDLAFNRDREATAAKYRELLDLS